MRRQELTVCCAEYVDQLFVNVVISIKRNVRVAAVVVDVVNVGWQWRRWAVEMETFLVLIVIEIVVFIIVLVVAWQRKFLFKV